MFSRCNNCVQVLTCNKCLENRPKRHSHLSKCTNTESPRKSQRRPDIVHHVDYEKLHQLPNNTCAESKSTSVIYANFISIQEEKSQVSSSNDNLQHSMRIYNDVDFNKTGNASRALLDRNIKSDSIQLDKEAISVNRPSNRSLSKGPAKIVNTEVAGQNLPNNAVNVEKAPIPKILNTPRIQTKVPGNHLRKAPPAPIVTSNNDSPKNNLENNSDKAINFSNMKLRKAEINKDQSSNSHHKTENKIEMFNVKLRKTPGKVVVSTNEDKSVGLLDKRTNETQLSKPIKKFRPVDTQIANNKDLKVKASSSSNFKNNVHNLSN